MTNFELTERLERLRMARLGERPETSTADFRLALSEPRPEDANRPVSSADSITERAWQPVRTISAADALGLKLPHD